MRENISHERVINKRPQLGIATKEVKSHVMQEIDSLKLIFPDKIIGIPPDQGYQKGIQIQIVPEQSYEDVTVTLTISLQFPAQYPQHVPKIDFLESEGVTQLQMTEIFQELFDIALSLTGESMIYQLIVKVMSTSIQCSEMVNSIHEQEYQNKLSSKNLHELFIREEKQKKRQKHKQTKLDEHLEKENYLQQTADELELRQKWLQERDKLEEDNIEEPLPSEKVLNWQGLSNQDLLLIHLMKIVMKSQNYHYYKQAQYLLHQFQVTQTKEHLKLLSPKYEVLFNNIYSRRFEQLLKAEQENIDYRLAELVNHSKPADKALHERSAMANVLFQPYYNSKQSNSFGMVKEPQQQSTQNQMKISTNSSSRMETDFEIVEVLGKGAFGEVFKVKNKIDGRYYAIKKIKVPQGAALNRILREVDLLSRLHHRHVIRYYQAWIDECHQDDNLYFSDEEDDELCLQSGFTQQTNSLYKMNSSYNDISQQQNQITLKKLEQTSGQVKKILILFIQTEYCTKTLKESIAKEYKSFDDAYIWTQFRQILEAMQYTHQQRIIHRDLKPENIFIDVTGDIKIGDFGLAKHTQKGNTNVIYSNSISDQQETEIQDILNYFASNQICENDLKMLDKTLNVGTYFYCPPSSSTTYSQPQFDEKRDIYALGVILLEMWFQFQNNRERVKILGSLRKGGKLPKKFLMHHKRQAALITWMLDENPSNRPTIIQILESEYLPPRIEDEYFKEALKVIGSSQDEIYYKQLIEAIFKNKHHKTILGANYIKSSNISFTSQYLPQIIKHMQQQCVLQINTSIFIDKDKEQQLSLLNNFGETIIFRSQLRQSFQKYLSTFNHKLLQSKTLKCFEIGEIFVQNDVLLIQQQLNFDQLIFNESSLASTLLNAIQLIEQFHSIIKIKINYQPLSYELLSNLSIFDKEHISSIFKYLTRIVSFNNSLNFTKLKVFIQNDHEDPIGRLIQSQYNDKIDKILSIFTYKQILFEDNKDEIYNFEQILKQQDYFKSCSQIILDFLIQFSQLNVLYRKLYPERCIYFIYDGSVNNQQYGFKNGFHFSIEIAHNNQIVYGGTYKKNFNKLQTICSVLVDASKSIDIKYDYFGQAPNTQRSNSLILNPKCDLPLSKIHSDSLSQGIKINQVQKQKVELSGYSINIEDLEKSIISKNTVLFKYQVLICSVGYNLSEIKKQFQLICLLNEIPTLMINDDDNQSFEDQILMAEKYDISLIIILRDKLYLSKGKAIVRWRKDKSKKDKEMTLEEFRNNLKIILKQ